ncbi:hypothetical protein E8F11_17135 [Pseudomonas sp. BN417]|nr:hypothetical protein [Pseudomonas sp. BN417]
MPAHCLNLCSRGGAATPPRQEAERNRCAGGRAAWMPREACGARDGPSRRAPGAMMERGKFGEARRGRRVPDAGASVFGFFFVGGIPTTEKRDSPGGETGTCSSLDKQLGSRRSSNP